jgi:hypothetical protein
MPIWCGLSRYFITAHTGEIIRAICETCLTTHQKTTSSIHKKVLKKFWGIANFGVEIGFTYMTPECGTQWSGHRYTAMLLEMTGNCHLSKWLMSFRLFLTRSLTILQCEHVLQKHISVYNSHSIDNHFPSKWLWITVGIINSYLPELKENEEDQLDTGN